jgi:hypothetical protein
MIRKSAQRFSEKIIAQICRAYAGHATVIDKGQIVDAAGIGELKANDAIRRRYPALYPGRRCPNRPEEENYCPGSARRKEFPLREAKKPIASIAVWGRNDDISIRD